MARVLVVAADADVATRAQIAAEMDGHEVTWCGGPQRPTYVCAGGRGEFCPRTARIDAVVVDGWLDSDALRCGVPSSHLILYYRRLGIPVLALVGPNGLPGPVIDDGIHAVARHATTEELRYALRDLLAGHRLHRRIPVIEAVGFGREAQVAWRSRGSQQETERREGPRLGDRP